MPPEMKIAYALITLAFSLILVAGASADCRGDVNLDGRITAEDARLLRQCLEGHTEGVNTQCADFNKNGVITLEDALCVEMLLDFDLQSYANMGCPPLSEVSNVCGNGVCEAGEHFYNCPQDCTSAGIEFMAVNTLPSSVRNNVVMTSITLQDYVLDKDNLDSIVMLAVNNSEVPVYAIPSSAKMYPSGFVDSMKIIFRDSFGPNETKEYSLYPNTPSLQVLKSSGLIELVDPITSSYKIRNNVTEYTVTNQFVPDDGINGYASLLVGRSDWIFYVLHPIPGNILSIGADPSYASFALGTGLPTETGITETQSFAAIYFLYNDSFIRASASNPLAKKRSQDYLQAAATVILFRGDPNLYIDSNYVLPNSFYNHNGFNDGAIIGFDSPLVITGTTTRLNLNAQTGDSLGLVEWPERSIDGNLVPIVYNVVGKRCHEDGIFGLMVDIISMFIPMDQVETLILTLPDAPTKFNDYYVVGETLSGILLYVPDYQRLVRERFKGDYTDDCDIAIPKSAIGSGIKDGKNFVGQVMVSSGSGKGWVPVYVPAGSYDSTTVIVPNLPFGESYRQEYDNEVALLNAISVTQVS